MTDKFKTGMYVGNRVRLSRVLLSIIFVVFVSLFVSGFGYQPLWVFIIVMLLGLFLTLPACFQDYWIINDDSIEIVSFSKNMLVKFGQLLNSVSRNKRVIEYKEINSVELIYAKRGRISPFDINPDYFKIKFQLKNSEVISLNIDNDLADNLANFTEKLSNMGIKIIDQQNILQLISKDENLYEYFNRK